MCDVFTICLMWLCVVCDVLSDVVWYDVGLFVMCVCVPCFNVCACFVCDVFCEVVLFLFVQLLCLCVFF